MISPSRPNTASKCGITPQFAELQELYTTYQNRGFEIPGFPCNRFANQDPDTDEEIQQFCKLNCGVTFPIFAKVDNCFCNRIPRRKNSQALT